RVSSGNCQKPLLSTSPAQGAIFELNRKFFSESSSSQIGLPPSAALPQHFHMPQKMTMCFLFWEACEKCARTQGRRFAMKYLHTMVRVTNIDASLDFYVNKLGLKELRRMDSEQGRYTLIFLAASGDETAQVELTYNWDPENY